MTIYIEKQAEDTFSRCMFDLLMLVGAELQQWDYDGSPGSRVER
jgi:hypothetical protein